MNNINTEKTCSHFLNVAYAFHENIQQPLAIADFFERGSDRWIVGLFHNILEETMITYADLSKELDKFDKGYLIMNIDKLTRKPTQEFSDYINELTGIEIEIKIAELAYLLSNKEGLSIESKENYNELITILMKQRESEVV